MSVDPLKPAIFLKAVGRVWTGAGPPDPQEGNERATTRPEAKRVPGLRVSGEVSRDRSPKPPRKLPVPPARTGRKGRKTARTFVHVETMYILGV
jgi:hypothetical protein